MAVTDLGISKEELGALYEARPTGRPGLMVYDGLGQEVDPLIEQLSSESARNFLFGNTVLHLGFTEGKKGEVLTVHKYSGVHIKWHVMFQRVLEVGVPVTRVERISIRPRANQGKQGMVEIKIPEGEDQPPLIMLPRRNFTPMAPIAHEDLAGFLSATLRHDPEPTQLTVVR